VAEALLKIENLTKHYRASGSFFSASAGLVRAVDGISFAIERGTTFALVGESGCGKTTVTKVVLRLEEPTNGVVRFRDKIVHDLKGQDLLAYKRAVQAVFQDPYASMNPRMRVLDVIAEPLRIHEGLRGQALRARIGELLTDVGLSPSAATLYPHQFSGGQRQRIAIARALALRPELMILDEPVSGLDVSIRAQILNLLIDLQREHGLTYLLVSHDLAIVEHMSHNVGVMYVGKLVELSDSEDFYREPMHPYSRALLAAVPHPDPDVPMGETVVGEVASPINPPSGCRFHPRCPIYANSAICREEEPALEGLRAGHRVACHKADLGAGEVRVRREAETAAADAGRRV
jgi:peptide/nickel transport system ATP-binding protein/oligopeptide transport system ATP-binding protein